MFKLIVGLANFDMRYFQTRHNVGAWYVQKLMMYHNQLMLKKEKKFYGYTGNLIFNGFTVRLLIPTTYMNRSGMSILAMTKFFQFSLDEILIVHDEINLSPGNMKLKLSGGHNGHNGVKDIIAKFKNDNFSRLRIGIGRPKIKDSIRNFVLSEPSFDEKNKINKLIDKLVICTEMIVLKKISTFINCLNR